MPNVEEYLLYFEFLILSLSKSPDTFILLGKMWFKIRLLFKQKQTMYKLS